MIRLGLHVSITGLTVTNTSIPLPSLNWILTTGYWVDSMTEWQDDKVWID